MRTFISVGGGADGGDSRGLRSRVGRMKKLLWTRPSRHIHTDTEPGVWLTSFQSLDTDGQLEVRKKLKWLTWGIRLLGSFNAVYCNNFSRCHYFVVWMSGMDIMQRSESINTCLHCRAGWMPTHTVNVGGFLTFRRIHHRNMEIFKCVSYFTKSAEVLWYNLKNVNRLKCQRLYLSVVL